MSIYLKKGSIQHTKIDIAHQKFGMYLTVKIVFYTVLL